MSLAGYQHVVCGPTQEGDVWVSHGEIKQLVDTSLFIDVETANKAYVNWKVYRRMDTPGHIHDELNPIPDLEWTRPVHETETKPSNPKDMIGSNKIPLHLWPTTASIMGSLALLDGMLKYGRTNYRAIGVRSSIYHDACKRHLDAWFEGEDDDMDSGLPHLAHALACIAVLIDAEASGKLNDDRVYPGKYREFINKLTPHVARLKAKHAKCSPKHYDINDGPA